MIMNVVNRVGEGAYLYRAVARLALLSVQGFTEMMDALCGSLAESNPHMDELSKSGETSMSTCESFVFQS